MNSVAVAQDKSIVMRMPGVVEPRFPIELALRYSDRPVPRQGGTPRRWAGRSEGNGVRAAL